MYKIIIIPALFMVNVLIAQVQPVRDFIQVEIDTAALKRDYSTHKQLPVGFETQALLALSFFPELKNTQIDFIVEETMTPLASRPTLWSVFKRAKNRHYMITISNKSKGIMDSILLGNLNYNAQVGVLAHELSHVADYHTMNFWQFVRLAFGLLSTSYMNKFEYNTDQICIDHGAGYQLLAWSKNTNQFITPEIIEKYFGKEFLTTERYMFPKTIEQKISIHPLYQNN
jgi:hypothetical protein